MKLDEYDDILSAKEAAEVLKVSMNTLYTMIRMKRIKAKRIGREWRIKKEDILR